MLQRKCFLDGRTASKTSFSTSFQHQNWRGCVKQFLYIFRNQQSDNHVRFMQWLARCLKRSKSRQDFNFSLNFSFSFFTNYLCHFLYVQTGATMSAFERQACTVIPIWTIIASRPSLWRQAFHLAFQCSFITAINPWVLNISWAKT